MSFYVQIFIQLCLDHWHDIKHSDGEPPALKIWGMWSTPSLPLLLGQLWPGVIVRYKVLSMNETEQTMYKQMTDVKLWLLYNDTWNH